MLLHSPAGISCHARNPPLLGYSGSHEKLQLPHRVPAPLIRHLLAAVRSDLLSPKAAHRRPAGASQRARSSSRTAPDPATSLGSGQKRKVLRPCGPCPVARVGSMCGACAPSSKAKTRAPVHQSPQMNFPAMTTRRHWEMTCVPDGRLVAFPTLGRTHSSIG